MSAEQSQREPTMEEILASIRRIISEEDKPAEAGGDVLDLEPAPAPEMKAPSPPQAAAPTPAPAPKQEPMPKAAMAPVYDEPQEFTPPARSIEEDLIVDDSHLNEPTEAEFEVEHEIAPEPAPVAAAPAPAARAWTPPANAAPTETLTSSPVAHQAAGTLGKLMGSMQVAPSGTLDDVVRELLKPMLKEWLDSNLPQIVEAEVAKEIDRIRRLAR